MKDLHLLPIGVLILSKVVIDTFVWHAEHRTKRKREKNDASCLSIHDRDVLGGFCLSFSLLLQSENPWTVLIIGESLNSPIQPKFVFSSCRTRSAESNRRWGSQKTAWLWLTSSRRRVVIYRSKFDQVRERSRAFPRILHFHPISLSNDGEDRRFSIPNRPLIRCVLLACKRLYRRSEILVGVIRKTSLHRRRNIFPHISPNRFRNRSPVFAVDLSNRSVR